MSCKLRTRTRMEANQRKIVESRRLKAAGGFDVIVEMNVI